MWLASFNHFLFLADDATTIDMAVYLLFDLGQDVLISGIRVYSKFRNFNYSNVIYIKAEKVSHIIYYWINSRVARY